MAYRTTCHSLFALVHISTVIATAVTLHNNVPRVDVNGHILDSHDGTLVQWDQGGLYYWYAMAYGDCAEVPNDGCAGMWGPPHCGFQLNHSIALHTSPDLVAWTFVADVLPPAMRPSAVYFRPHVVFNPTTMTFVLWVNAVRMKGDIVDYGNTSYVVATSRSAVGPFTVVNAAAATRYGQVGDVTLFVDSDADGAAYAAYAAWADSLHSVSIERLTPDFTDSAWTRAGANASSGPVGPGLQEAPILFRRGATYYLIIGAVCCFCSEGAGSHVFTATHPLGPWTDSGIDIDAGPGPTGNASLLGAQNSFVFRVPIAAGGNAVVWVGDRWGSAADGLKSHDVQFWSPLAFNDSTAPPTIAALYWMDNFTLDTA